MVIAILRSRIATAAPKTRTGREPTNPISRSMPTEMKKIPLNVSRKGRTSETAWSPYSDSEITSPARKVPSARDRPKLAVTNAAPTPTNATHTEVSLDPAEQVEFANLHDHAIIVGYGLGGQHLARVLRAAGLTYVVLEQNGEAVRRGREEGDRVLFGDGTRQAVLEKVGITNARVVVFAIADPTQERRGVANGGYPESS